MWHGSQCENQCMAHGHRLSALDTSFLHLETGGAHMHVAAVMTFEGDPPAYEELRRAHRQRGCTWFPATASGWPTVPLGQGRPVWVDDPHFNSRYHVRHTALPAPGERRASSSASPGRLFAQRLDRAKPLWEIWLVEGLDGGRFALIAKTHHALVDGVSGVDIASVLFDAAPDPPPAPAARAPGTRARCPPARSCWPTRCSSARPCRAEAARGMRALTRAPRQALGGGPRRPGRRRRDGLGRREPGAAARRSTSRSARTAATRGSTPTSPSSRRSRTRWAARSTTSCSTVGGAARSAAGCAARGTPTDGLVLKAMVPVSVRADAERGALGNRVAAMWAPLPVGVRGPGDVLRRRARGDGAASRAPARPSARRRSPQLAELRAADDHEPGRAAAGPPAASSTSSSPTSPARSSRCTCSGAGCAASTPSCRWPATRRWASRS